MKKFSFPGNCAEHKEKDLHPKLTGNLPRNDDAKKFFLGKEDVKSISLHNMKDVVLGRYFILQSFRKGC